MRKRAVTRMHMSWRTLGIVGLAVVVATMLVFAVYVVFLDARPQQAAQPDAPDAGSPTLTSVVPISPDALDCVFSEPLGDGSVSKSNFSIDDGTRVTEASRIAADTVRLRLQEKLVRGRAYTASVEAGAVKDAAGNPSRESSLRFTGFGASGGTLTVSQGEGSARPRAAVAKEQLDAVVVDQISFTATGGDATVSQVRVRALTTGENIFSDLIEAWIFEDNGDGRFQQDGRDRQLHVSVPFTGTAPGSPATFSDLRYVVPSGETRTVWVVFRLGNYAINGRYLGSLIMPGDIQLTAGALVHRHNLRSANRGRTIYVDERANDIASGRVVDPRTVLVTLKDRVDPSTVTASDFTVNNEQVQTAEPGPDGSTIRVTTKLPLTTKTVTVVYAPQGDTPGDVGLIASFAGPTYQSPGDTLPPSVPGGVSASVGSSAPVVAVVTWSPASDNNVVAGYRIWRATSAAGSYRSIATTPSSPFRDTTGIRNQNYNYRVSSFDPSGNESALSAASGSVTATWTQLPHAAYGAGDLCKLCHSSHGAGTTSGLIRKTAGGAGESALCYECHDGSGASTNVKTGASNSFALVSGHTLESLVDTTNVDLTNQCSDCHSPHKDPAGRPALWRTVVNGNSVTGNNNTWCNACHDPKHSWYKSGESAYDALIASPTVNASGYPTLGTFPGSDVATNPAKNGHATVIEAAQSEAFACKACHDNHRGTDPQDMLLYPLRPSSAASVTTDRQTGAYAQMCLRCHDGGVAQASNIKQHVTANYGDPDANAGHRVRSPGASQPAGSPLPCYECHNVHGSGRGNKSNFSDALGGSLTTTAGASAEQVRQFCLTCHTDSDAMVWDSVLGSYRSVRATETVVGLPRNGNSAGPNSETNNWLKLKSVSGHSNNVADRSKSCYTCHGGSYGSGESNVHNPSAGLSLGGVDCYGCHSSYQLNMEDGVGVKTGANRATAYHHVLGGTVSATYYDGDKAFAGGTYPTLAGEVFCLSCHVDHDKFNGGKSGNLRQGLSVEASAATDYSSATNVGVCTDCHATSLAKQVVTDQKNDGSAFTPKIAAGGGANQFGASAHDYYATSNFGDSTTFSANCTKCHNDEQSKSFQTSANRFGTHWSTARRILSALGGTVTDPLAEEQCYRCHSRVAAEGDGTLAGARKTAAGRDWYNATTMTAGSERVYAQFQLASKHPVRAAGGNSVECENCHNAHVVTPTTGKVTDPDNGYSTAAYATDANQVTFCLKCHDGTLPTYNVSGASYVPTSVTQGDTAVNNKSMNSARGHWSQSGAIGSGEEVSCAECHDNHGSSAPKLLGAYDLTDSRNEINASVISANDNAVCASCHTGATGAAYTRDATGYPTVGTWPGMSVYNGASGIHKGTSVKWPTPSTRTDIAGGDCKQCHDVHGTANGYDELKGTFSQSNFGTCFECHDGAPASRNIKQYYPAGNGGTATQSATSSFGHKIQTAGGEIAVGDGLPCYDCHNPHGSAVGDGLVVETSIGGVKYLIGDSAAEITTSTAGGLRLFCFTCHTGDTSAVDSTIQGTSSSGIGFVAISAATDFIEGIDRTSYNAGAKTGLHLPAINGHYTTLGSQGSCYGCHGNSYSGATSSNVHNPSPGISTGQTDCYACHTTYQTYMEDGIGAKQGGVTERVSVYHHVMGSASNDGDKAFAPGSYPSSTTDVYCMSCHVDHDKFNGSKSSNLRSAISAETAMAADFGVTGTTSYYASSLAQTSGTWTGAGNSTGAPEDLVASSPSQVAFEGRQSFSLGALSNISAASVTVRSRAKWSGLASASEIVYPTSDVGAGSWTTRVPASPTTNWDKIDDPAGSSDGDTSYIQGNNTTEYQAGTASPTIPSGATNIMVTVVWAMKDGAVNAVNNYAQLRVNSNYYGTGTAGAQTVPVYNPPDATTYRTYGTAFALNPATNAQWTAATVNTINGLAVDMLTAGTMRLSQAYIKVTYDTSQVIYPTSDVAAGSWTTRFPTSPATNWDKIDDPAPISFDDATTYVQSTGTTAYTAGTPLPSVPVGATNIMATVVWRLADSAAVTQANRLQLRVGGTLYGTAGTHVGTVDPGITYATFAESFVDNPATGLAWTPATINTVNGFGFVAGGINERATQGYLVVTYDPAPVTPNDTWAIQYSTNNGSNWSDITAASTANEAALTDHTLSLTGIVTDANYNAFQVRIRNNLGGGTYDAGASVDWDATTLSLTTGGGNGVCMSCHSIALAKDKTYQRTFGKPPSSVTPTLSVGAFGSSAHSFQATSTYGDGSVFGADCSKCHNDEDTPSYKTFQTSTRKFGTHWSAERRILAAMGVAVVDPIPEENECFRCHSVVGQGLKSFANSDWYGVVSMDASSQAIFGMSSRAFRHNVAGYVGLHPTSSQDETQGYISANKHVECADCHNVHAAGKTAHTAGGAAGNAIGSNSPIQDVSGVTFSTGTSANWSLTGSALAPTNDATKEYQICFKCHSSANTSLSAWGPAAPQQWTDQALEFNPANRSGHPIVDTQNNSAGRTAPKALTSAQMLSPWLNVGNQTMMCSDCHGDSGGTPAAQGPHGSTAAHILKGPNTYWPTNGAGALYKIGSGSAGWAESNLDGLFCRNCHRIYNGSGYFNNTHSEHGATQGASGAGACINCHILVPHGGKNSRLMAGTGTMPSRYAYLGNLGYVGFGGFVKNNATSYIKDNCTGGRTPTGPSGVGCTSHSNAAAGEVW